MRIVPTTKNNRVGSNFGLTEYKLVSLSCESKYKPDDIKSHTYLFDLLDMTALLALINKDPLVRKIATILCVETGKLNRLLLHKDQIQPALADLLYNEKEWIKQLVI